jgi:ribosome biogenesis GTPase / thiamine phosphate phosphatase
MTELSALGWDEGFASLYQAEIEAEHLQKLPRLVPGRVSRQDRGWVTALGEAGPYRAEASGRLKRALEAAGTVLVTGDWVVLEPLAEPGRARVHAMIPRRTRFARKAPGSGEGTAEQIIAANIDAVLLVSGLDGDFNPRRLERGLTLVKEGGSLAVVILNKCDLSPDPEAAKYSVEAIAPGVAVHLTSAATGVGLDAIRAYLGVGRTVALLGSSGVGKSTLVNALLGEAKMGTSEVRAHDSRGRHTTTYRELWVLPSGGLIIDTPGMRELQLLGEEVGLGEAFADVEALASACRFDDCRHTTEPGCAVKAAVEGGELSDDRYQSFLKLKKEIEHEERKVSPEARAQRKAKEKSITRAAWDASRNKRR